MPTGFTLEPPDDDESTGSQPCGKDTGLRARAVRNVEAEFTEGAFGPLITHVIGAYKSGEAKDAFDRARQLTEECREWTEPDKEGKPTTYRLAPLSFPRLGDQTFAMRMDVKTDTVAVQADVIYVRRGDLIFLLGNIVAGVGVATVDSELTEQMARRADEKLAALR